MFAGQVTGLTLVSFSLMVGSSIIAAWADISSSFKAAESIDAISGLELVAPKSTIGGINAGYFWMATNCLASAAYVSWQMLFSISKTDARQSLDGSCTASRAQGKHH